jgi:hypothetical protein
MRLKCESSSAQMDGRSTKEELVLHGEITKRLTNGIENFLGHLRVGRTSYVDENLFLFILMERNEFFLQIFNGFLVVTSTIIIRKANSQIDVFDLLSKQIGFIQEENKSNITEPLTIASLSKKHDTFLHTICGVIFVKSLIVLAQSHEKDNGSNVLETMNPFPSLRTLSTNINHFEASLLHLKFEFANSGSTSTTMKNVSVRWEIIGLHDAIEIFEEIVCCIHNLELTMVLLEKCLHGAVAPKPFNPSTQLRCDSLYEC